MAEAISYSPPHHRLIDRAVEPTHVRSFIVQHRDFRAKTHEFPRPRCIRCVAGRGHFHDTVFCIRDWSLGDDVVYHHLEPCGLQSLSQCSVRQLVAVNQSSDGGLRKNLCPNLIKHYLLIQRIPPRAVENDHAVGFTQIWRLDLRLSFPGLSEHSQDHHDCQKGINKFAHLAPP